MRSNCLVTFAALGLGAASAVSGGGVDRELQSSNPRVIASIFECDEFLVRIPSSITNKPKKIGAEIRICIEPNVPSRQRSIVMRTVDDFTWFKSFGSAVQKAVENKGELENTLLLCIPGRLTCSFKTQLQDKFFYGTGNGTITGSGTVSMQVNNYEADGGGDGAQRQLLKDSTYLRASVEFRMLQTSIEAGDNPINSYAGGYAGSDGVSIDISVEGVPKPSEVLTPEEQDLGSWWDNAPIWLKVLIIGGGIFVIIMALCLCCLCCYAMRDYLDEKKDDDDQVNKDVDEEDTSEEQDNRNSTWNEYDPKNVVIAGNIEGAPQPTDNDICFDADGHPGTVAFQAALHTSVLQFLDDEYSPTIYRHVKKQLPGRRFFVCDDEDHPDTWREVPKQELVGLVGKEFEDVRSKYKQSQQKSPRRSARSGLPSRSGLASRSGRKLAGSSNTNNALQVTNA